MASPEQWLAKLPKLRIDRARGDPAPHKPLLLLTVLELAEQGQLPNNLLPLSPELAFRFFSYWTVVAQRRKQKPDIRLPFHYLQSDGFWTALGEDGKPSPHCRLTRFAELTADFVACARTPSWRERARRVMVATYFRPEEQVALFELMGLPVPSDLEIKRDLEAATRKDAELRGREARFRILKALRQAVAADRKRIEDCWVISMIRQGRLTVQLNARKVTLVAYPGTPESFLRTIDLGDLMGKDATDFTDEDVRLSADNASLQIRVPKSRHKGLDIGLPMILWRGSLAQNCKRPATASRSKGEAKPKSKKGVIQSTGSARQARRWVRKGRHRASEGES